MLVDAAGGQWIFFVEVPFALLVPGRGAARGDRGRRMGGGQSFDLAGAMLAASGLLALVYA